MREIYETREEYEMAMRSGIGNNYILPMESNEEVKVLQEKLKELLKECQYMILAYSINHDTFTKEKVIDIIKQIDNAIGEK